MGGGTESELAVLTVELLQAPINEFVSICTHTNAVTLSVHYAGTASVQANVYYTDWYFERNWLALALKEGNWEKD